MTDQKLYDLKAAAKVVGYSIATLKAEIAAGNLRAKRRLNDRNEPTGAYRVTPKALDEWIEGLGDA